MSFNTHLALFINRIKALTELDATLTQQVFNNLIEEVGEFSTAFSVEQGSKQKHIDEPAKNEAIDVIIMSIALFVSMGCTIEELVEIGHKKLDKWMENNNVYSN